MTTAAPSANGHPAANGTPRLLPQHLADLLRSGLEGDYLDRLGVYSETDPTEIAKLLGQPRRYAERLGACAVFPFTDTQGNRFGYHRLKPDNPQTPKKATKPKKYEAPKGAGNQAYFPPDTIAALADPSIPLRIFEGEKKAAAADKSGRPGIGVSGVWNWCQKREKRADGSARGKQKLIESLEAVQWQGRTVYLEFDSDQADNPSVALAQYRLAVVLAEHGATVLVVKLPHRPNGEKQGVDDYLLTHTVEELDQLEAEAKPPEPPDTGDAKALEVADDPHRLGRLFLAARAAHPERPLVAFYRESFHRWHKHKWCKLPDSDFRGEVANFCETQLREDAKDEIDAWDGKGKMPTVRKVTLGLVGSILQALSGKVLVPQEVVQPAWLGESEPEYRDYIALRNGLLDVAALLNGSRNPMRPHNPSWFSPVCLPFDFNPGAVCPKWTAFLERNLGGDQGKATLLQQFFGYLLATKTSLQAFLLMLGEGSNGKSVILAVLEAVLGTENISTVPLEMFADKFRLYGTLGKLANLVAECGELDKVAEGSIKAYVSGDPLNFEEKFKPAISARPTARLVVATNSVPAFADKTDGVWRRMLVLRFTVQIPAEERVAGMDRPDWWHEQGELSGILNWAMVGLYAIRQQGGFTIPADCKAEVERLRSDANPARRFLQEHYHYSSAEFTPCEDAYKRYSDWCKSVGHHPMADIGFGKEVARVFRQVERKQKTLQVSGRKWCYLGLAEMDCSALDAPDAPYPPI